jgi:hypothetical protein
MILLRSVTLLLTVLILLSLLRSDTFLLTVLMLLRLLMITYDTYSSSFFISFICTAQA